ncbi:MAG: OmpH family outer membrane protein [Nitrospira sp.]|nr:OmpH family outer membrane protein [Nitrospira sp.]
MSAVTERAHKPVRLSAARRQTLVIVTLGVVGLLTVGCAAISLRGGGQKIEGKIGLIDSSRVWSESNLGKKLKDTLTAYENNRRALLEADVQELQRMQEDLKRVGESHSLQPDGIMRRRQQLQERFEAYQQKNMELNREIQEKGRDVSEGFRVKVDEVVAKVAKRISVQVVIEKGKGGPTFYGEEGLDVTSQVIEEFNREHP